MPMMTHVAWAKLPPRQRGRRGARSAGEICLATSMMLFWLADRERKNGYGSKRRHRMRRAAGTPPNVWLDRLDRARLAVCAMVLLLTFWLMPGGRRVTESADED